MALRSFEIKVPYRLEMLGDVPIVLTVKDNELLGSPLDFVRLDLYPILAPNHPERHFAWWDIPMSLIRRERTEMVLRDMTLVIAGEAKTEEIGPQWRGRRPPLGYCRLHVSLWHLSEPALWRKAKYGVWPEGPVDLADPRQPEDRWVECERRWTEHVCLNDSEVLPLEYMQIPFSQKCNLSCPMCTRHTAGLDEIDLPEDVLAGILEAAPHIHYMGIQGIGEPLMNPDAVDIIRKLRAAMPAAGRLALTTNGTLMKGDRPQQLIDAGVNNFSFSIDGATKETCERGRAGAVFEELLDNVSRTVKLGKASGRKHLWFASNFTVTKSNLQEIPDFVHLAASLGLDTITFFEQRSYPSGGPVPFDHRILAPLLQQAQKIGEEAGVVVKLADPTMSATKRCMFMQVACLWITGEVLPCYRMEPPGKEWPVSIFGNIARESLLDIWEKPECRAFHARVLRGDTCAGCTFNDTCAL